MLATKKGRQDYTVAASEAQVLLPTVIAVPADLAMGSASGKASVVSDGTKKYSALVVGQSGAGKTSFLNLVANFAKVAAMADTEELTFRKLRHLHKEAGTDRGGSQHKSQTTKACAHTLSFGPLLLTMVDTPGFGDNDGPAVDKKNLQSIMDVVRAHNEINCIVLVVNGREPKLSPQLQYVIHGISAILPNKVTNQLLVVFTQTTRRLDLRVKIPAVQELLGAELPQARQVLLDNPYALLANLMDLAQEEGGVENMQEEIQEIKEAFCKAKLAMEKVFQRIADFQPVETHEFTKLYELKQSVEKKAVQLGSKLRNISESKQRLRAMKSDLQDAQRAKEAAKDFEIGTVTKWFTTETAGITNMICNECHSNCHEGCSIDRGLENVMVFKDCQCFQWNRQKTLKINSVEDRQKLLDNLWERELQFADVETLQHTKKEVRVGSSNNFKIGDVEVRGDPETTWLPKGLATNSLAADPGLRLNALKSKAPYFEVIMTDRSNQEKGSGMECRACGCVLSSHYHQTTKWESKSESVIDDIKKRRFLNAKTEEEKQQGYVAECERQLATLAAEEKDLVSQLRSSLREYQRSALVKNLRSLLEGQLKYLQQLREMAKAAANHEQEEEIEALIDEVDQIIRGIASASSEATSASAASTTRSFWPSMRA